MEGQISYRKLISLSAHILAWVVFSLAIFYYQPLISDIDIPSQFWVKQTLELSLLIITFYLNSILLVPKLLFRNRPAIYLVIAISIILGVAFTQRKLDTAYNAYQSRNMVPAGGLMRPLNLPRLIPGTRGGSGVTLTITITALVVGISTAITAIKKWQQDNQQRKELEKEKISSELSFLKAQIQPHFFFNTLNNIYVLTEVDPASAGEAIHQLSKMMRYLIYDTQHGDTMLSQEIDFVKNYISLMKLRLTDVVKVTLDTPINLQDMPLAPMIFLPFVENAFKHGISATRQSYIHITISQKDKSLRLTVNNSVMKENSVSLDNSSGIGLINTRRRLDLIYPDRYTLNINEPAAGSEYTVHLVMDLS